MKNHITIDLSKISKEYFNLINISSIQASMLRWSQRENIIGSHHKKTKAFVAGTCLDKKNSQKQFIIQVGQDRIQKSKMLETSSDEITALGFGPYDNGYILIGMKTGNIIILDPISLEKLAQINISKYVHRTLNNNKITGLTFDPTQMIFVNFDQGDLIGLTLDPKKFHYNYFEVPNDETGDKIYCTTV